MKSTISLHQLELMVKLGWFEEERSQKQKVILDATIQFAEMPPACVSDELTDTFCYNALVQTIKQNIETREFRLLEHFGHELYQIIKKELIQPAQVSLRVTKKPDIAGLTAGVSFFCGD